MYSSSKSKTSSRLAFLKGFTDEMKKIAANTLTGMNKAVAQSGPLSPVGGTSRHRVQHYSKPATLPQIQKTAPLGTQPPPAVTNATTISPPAP
jgi:hypothetical protein